MLVAHWDGRGLPVDELSRTVREFLAAGKRVVVTDDVPTFPFEARECQRATRLVLPEVRCSMPLEDHLERRSGWSQDLESLVARNPGVVRVTTPDLFCADDSCSMASDGSLWYRDYNHLNLNGSRRIAQHVGPIIQALHDGPPRG